MFVDTNTTLDELRIFWAFGFSLQASFGIISILVI